MPSTNLIPATNNQFTIWLSPLPLLENFLADYSAFVICDTDVFLLADPTGPRQTIASVSSYPVPLLALGKRITGPARVLDGASVTANLPGRSPPLKRSDHRGQTVPAGPARFRETTVICVCSVTLVRKGTPGNATAVLFLTHPPLLGSYIIIKKTTTIFFIDSHSIICQKCLATRFAFHKKTTSFITS